MTEDEKQRIFQTLDCGDKRYYVYALCTDDGPFYIGKGAGERVLQHMEAAELAAESVQSDDTLSEEEKNMRIRALSEKIQTILDNKQQLIHVIIKWGLSEHEAFMCESSLINLLNFNLFEGKKIKHLTNIVNGHASNAEKASVADQKTCARTLEQFLQECALQERDISGIKEDVAFIKINSTYGNCRDKNGLPDIEKVRDCVAGTWEIAKWRQKKIKYVFALYRGRVVGIFHVNRISSSLGEAYAEGLLGFPSFPPEDRKMDRLVSQFATIESAHQVLSSKDYAKFEEKLKKTDKNKQEKPKDIVLSEWRKRIYFIFDNEIIPDDLKCYQNCILTKKTNSDYFKGQSTVLYNF